MGKYTYTGALMGALASTTPAQPKKRGRKPAKPRETVKPRPIAPIRPPAPTATATANTNIALPKLSTTVSPPAAAQPTTTTGATSNVIVKNVFPSVPKRPAPNSHVPDKPVKKPLLRRASIAASSSAAVANKAKKNNQPSESSESSESSSSESSSESEEEEIKVVKRRVGRPRKDEVRKHDSNANTTKQKVEKKSHQAKKKVVNDPTPPKRSYKQHDPEPVLPIFEETYQLKTVIKGHTNINIPVRVDTKDTEDSKDIWCCEFEPTKNLKANSTVEEGKESIVALCGSYTVLFLDVLQGRYVKKYTHPEIQEIFYCMAWTRLRGKQLLNADVVDDDEACNVLAIAGRLGSIKLMNPLQNECYRYLFGHKKPVLAMTFAKSEPRWLLSASADKTVRLWDIGSPTSRSDDSACLAKFELPANLDSPSAISISYDLSTVIVGCASGDIVKYKLTAKDLSSFRTKAQEYREKEATKGDKWALGPIATIKHSMIYPAGDEWHEGYVDDVYILGQDGNTKNELSNNVVSRAAEDMEIIIWDPVKSTEDDADIRMSLDWPDAAECTGLRFKVIEKNGQKALIAGEYEGQIRIFNIGTGEKSKTLPDGSKEQFEPVKILSHSMSSELIRDITCSSDTRTIVAVDNNNSVFVWAATSNKGHA